MALPESRELADTSAGEGSDHTIAPVVRWTFVPSESPGTIHSFVMRWNGQWVSGDRVVRDYAAGVMLLDSEVMQAVSRFHRSGSGVVDLEVETHAVTWAAVLVAVETANFRAADREILLAALLAEMRPYWSQNEPSHAAHAAHAAHDAIPDRAMNYLALQDPANQLDSAARIVISFLRTIGMREPIAPTALARHLIAVFGDRILRDIYRLSAAARLRTAVTS
jgi:hypothetical protein